MNKMYLIGVRHFQEALSCQIFNLLFFIWVVMETVILIRTGWRSFRSEVHKEIKDAGSYLMVLSGNWISVILSIICMSKTKVMMPFVVGWIGIALLAFGLGLRIIAFWILRRYFTVTVTTSMKQTLIQKGPYKFVRHPAYSGSICIVVGIALALRTSIGLMGTMLLVLLVYSYRISIEEKALRERFGSEYLQYSKHTGRILPRII